MEVKGLTNILGGPVTGYNLKTGHCFTIVCVETATLKHGLSGYQPEIGLFEYFLPLNWCQITDYGSLALGKRSGLYSLLCASRLSPRNMFKKALLRLLNAAQIPLDVDSNFVPNQLSQFRISVSEAAAMAGAPPVIIWEREVESLLHYKELIPRLEEALGKFSSRDSAEVIQPVRSTVPLQKHNG